MNYRKIIFLIVALCAAQFSFAQQSPRERISINFDWRFAKGDPEGAEGKLAYNNIKNWMLSTGQEFVVDADAARHVRPEGNIGNDVAYTRADFDDSSWRKLNLPHDFAIEGPFIPTANGATGKLPFPGVVWYRKTLDIPAADQGKQIYLDIDGAMSYANIWLNGQYAGGWGYGYSSFSVDLTPYVKPGGQNVLSIRLDNPNTSSRWYPGGGIYRNVWLVKTLPVHVGQWGTFVTTPEVSSTSATVDVKVTIDNKSKAGANVSLRTEIYAIDANDKRTGSAVASTVPSTVQIEAGKRELSAAKATISNPRLWSIEQTNRYVAVTTLQQDGKTLDTYETPFGVRTIKYDPAQGFFLNGKPLEFQGVCNHHDLGALGNAISTRAIQRQLEILKEMGCNAIRTAHNPPAPELLDLCDKMGFVVIDEAFDCWVRGKNTNDYNKLFVDWSERDMRALIRRDRNHPSIILWSIGNEVGEQRNAAEFDVGRRLARFVHEDDPTRPMTAASQELNFGYNGFQDVVDIFGYNYLRPPAMINMYIQFHETHPNKFVFSSESASAISSRGVYVFPVTNDKGGGFTPDRQMSSYDLYAPPWAQPPDMEFEAQDKSPFSGGEFVWTGFDYIGEPTVNGGFGFGRRGRGPASGPATGPTVARGPSTAPALAPDTRRSSYFGIIDLAGFPKDRYYIYQARWRPDLPMAHILPHWNWAERGGEVTPVHVYSSGDEAELFLNGKSQGRKKKEQYQYRFRWDDVKYEPGELKVVTWKAGKEWATKTMKTTGPATKLAMKPDRSTILSNGDDLSFVTVSIADKDGAMVPRSMNLVKFSITGPGDIVATDNGDPTSMVAFPSHERNAFNGLALVIVRAKPGQAGQIILKAESEGLEAVQVPITATR